MNYMNYINMSFPPIQPVNKFNQTSNIDPSWSSGSYEYHEAQIRGYELVYTGNYEGQLNISVAPGEAGEYILVRELANEYLHHFYLSIDLYNRMKVDTDIILDLGGGNGEGALSHSIEEGGWYIDWPANTYATYMKEHARAYIYNGFLYIDDTGEYGPHSIPIKMIDNLVNGIYECPRLRITWNDETKTNEVEEIEEEDNEDSEDMKVSYTN
jgi:hypothetical protein